MVKHIVSRIHLVTYAWKDLGVVFCKEQPPLQWQTNFEAERSSKAVCDTARNSAVQRGINKPFPFLQKCLDKWRADLSFPSNALGWQKSHIILRIHLQPGLKFCIHICHNSVSSKLVCFLSLVAWNRTWISQYSLIMNLNQSPKYQMVTSSK